MRLINTKTLQLEEFLIGKLPEYAILSHRWDEKEVSFQEFEKNSDKSKSSFEKIRQACALAVSRDRDWIWIDTCCINKKSSAELTEAINSMFEWYEKAKECYVYLNDVDLDILEEFDENSPLPTRSLLCHSKWFTRGWTLQELLAPWSVLFYDRCWKYIGDKAGGLREELSNITGIATDHLMNQYGASCAKKMSWMANRQTSRPEDIAYCLLGLFDVNMPLLYGEGKKAFIRLQLEIIRKSDDESIFAWTDHVIYIPHLVKHPAQYIEHKRFSLSTYDTS